MEHVTLMVDGLSEEEAPAVRHALERVPGLVRCHVNAPLEAVYVAYDPRVTGPAPLAAALAGAGFSVGDPAVRRPAGRGRGGDRETAARLDSLFGAASVVLAWVLTLSVLRWCHRLALRALRRPAPGATAGEMSSAP